MRRSIHAVALMFVLMCVWGPGQAVPQQPDTGGEKPGPSGPSPKFAEMGQQLVKALKASPGCLGTEIATTASGKNVIFAWFKDKKACLDWYYSPAHKKMMKDFFTGQASTKPLKDVPDDCGPILAIASLTPSAKPLVDGIALPVSQISIELYTPLKGGISAGGTFAPPGIDVPKVEPKSTKE